MINAMGLEGYGYLASILMGLSLGLIGGGGAILTVPILVYLFSILPVEATSLSLFIVGSTALAGATLAFRNNNIDLKIGTVFALPSFLGVFLTKSLVIPRLPEQLIETSQFILTKSLFLMIIFAVLMLLASTAMIFKKNGTKSSESATDKVDVSSEKTEWLRIGIQGIFVGSVTGLVGAGGGFLIVPALVNILGLNMRKAIGTSLAIIAANSLFGFGIALSHGLEVHWIQMGGILAGSLLGLGIGVRWSAKISEQKLKQGFGYFVLIMGCIILWDQIHKLSN